MSGSTTSSGSVASTDASKSATSVTGTAETSRSSAEIAAASTDVTTRITEWRLAPAELQADIDRGVTIVRTKDSVVGAPTGSTDDSVIETMVKGKLQADSETSAAKIEVSAKNGEVTLKGEASSATQIGRAIALALDTQGVTKVSSDLKVSASK